MSVKIPRSDYAIQYGPTKGDRIHLADTGLVAEIEHDYGTYGDEMVFGPGKTIRDGAGHSGKWSYNDGALDFVITNAVIMDPVQGIVKGDIGIRDGKFVGVGKAGNPDTMDITPGLVVSANTDILSVEGKIVTPGLVDAHVHFDSVQTVYEFLNAGFTSLFGGGTGPHTVGIECPGQNNLRMMLQAMADFPVNFANWGKGNAISKGVLREQVLNGATGFKIHEDWGATHAVTDVCLQIGDEYDIPIMLHTDTLNEAGYMERTLETINGRVMHMYHVEGTGGGHAPDLLKCCGEPNLLTSSTSCANPFCINTWDESLGMLITCHNLNVDVPTDIAFAHGRARAETMRAEDVLHDIGAISMMTADNQGMGRAGESALKSFQLAAVNKVRYGKLPEDSPNNDNFRIKRYLSKVTINPCIATGVSQYIGSIEPGKLADLVVWRPDMIFVKPQHILKGGYISRADMGEPNGSLMTTQPTKIRPQYAAFGSNPSQLSYSFVPQAAIDDGLADRLGSHQTLMPVHDVRTLSKRDMLYNDWMGEIEIDPESYSVYVDGERATVKPAKSLPMSQLYFFR